MTHSVKIMHIFKVARTRAYLEPTTRTAYFAKRRDPLRFVPFHSSVIITSVCSGWYLGGISHRDGEFKKLNRNRFMRIPIRFGSCLAPSFKYRGTSPKDIISSILA